MLYVCCTHTSEWCCALIDAADGMTRGSMQRTTCNVQHAACNAQHATCSMQHAARSMQQRGYPHSECTTCAAVQRADDNPAALKNRLDE
jgi:hypothetical protein